MKWNRGTKKTGVLCFIMVLAGALTGGIFFGNQMEEKSGEQKTAVEFAICGEAALPDELRELIEEKKEEPFQLTFQNSAHLYIVVGYGEQPSGEYVAAVRELYETERGIYADTSLISISYAKEMQVGDPSTYPYVVLKCEKKDKTVFFI